MLLILPSFHRFARFWLSLFGLVGSLALPVSQAQEDPAAPLERELVFVEAHYDADALSPKGLRNSWGLAASGDGKHVYAVSMDQDAIGIYARDVDVGTLSFVGLFQDPLLKLNGARAIEVSPDGRHAYVVSMLDNALLAFARDAATGSLTFIEQIVDNELAAIDGLAAPRGLAISPDGKSIYVVAFEDRAVSMFSRNVSDGGISYLGRLKHGADGVSGLSSPEDVEVSPDGKHVYVALSDDDAISYFGRNLETGILSYQGKLTQGVDFADGLDSPRSIAVSGDGKQVYVAVWNDDAVTQFKRDLETGALTRERTYENGKDGIENLDGAFDLVVSPDDKYVYVVANASHAVVSFERDATTGNLSFYRSSANADEDVSGLRGPRRIVASPDGENVYVSASSDRSLVVFRRDVVIDPPVFVVQPVSASVAEGGTAAFYALAIGIDVGYQWRRDGEALAGETHPVLSIDALAPSAAGVYTVEVANAGGSLFSDAAALTVLPPIVLRAPSDLTALEISSSKARLAWTDESDNETGFEIQRRRENTETYETVGRPSSDANQFEDATIAASTTYFYRARALRLEMESSWSNEAVIESWDDVPQPPVDLQVDLASYNKVRISWRDRSAVEDGFRIQRRSSEESSAWQTIADYFKDADAYEDRSVQPGTTYAYRVQAYNESGASAFSNAVVAVTLANPVSQIEPVSREVPEEGGTYGLAVRSDRAWEVLSDVGWIAVTAPAGGQGSGDGSVEYRVTKNDSQAVRVGRLNVGGLVHTVTQEKSNPFLLLDPLSSQVGFDGGSLGFEVYGNEAWTVSVDEDWLSIESGSYQEGVFLTPLSVRVAANESVDRRVATLTVAGGGFVREARIEQSGVNHVLGLDSFSYAHGPEAGALSLNVTSNLDWTATSDSDWLTINAGQAGSGDGLIELGIARNESLAARMAVVTVSGGGSSETHVVTQAASPPFVELSSSDTQFAGLGGSGSLSINANVSWRSRAYEDWIRIEEPSLGNGDGTVTFAIERSFSRSARSGKIYVNREVLSIEQASAAVSAVAAPSFEPYSTPEDLGVLLAWNDLSSVADGYVLERSLLGSEDYELVKIFEIAKDGPVTRYFDRAAERANAYTYRISSFDALGLSIAFGSLTTEELANAEMVYAVGSVFMGTSKELVYGDVRIQELGPIQQLIQGFGPSLGAFPLDGCGGSRLIQGAKGAAASYLGDDVAEIAWEASYPWLEAGIAGLVSERSDGLLYAYQKVPGSRARVEGLSLRTVLSEADPVAAIGFELAGAFDVPVLLRGLGRSLGANPFLADPQISLYRVGGDGVVSLVALSEEAALDDPVAFGVAPAESLREAVARLGALPVQGSVAEAGLLLRLEPGRYLCLLRSASGSSQGAGVLELIDAR